MGGVSPQVWFAVCVIVVAGMLFGFFGRRGQVRRAKSAQADARGWIYKGTNIALTRRWPGEPFVEGVRQEAQDILTGNTDGIPFTSFSYRVAVSAGEGQGGKVPLVPFHVVVVPVPDAVPAGALSTSPVDLTVDITAGLTDGLADGLADGWQVRECGDDMVAWRPGEQDMDAVEPAVAAMLAWAGAALT